MSVIEKWEWLRLFPFLLRGCGRGVESASVIQEIFE